MEPWLQVTLPIAIAFAGVVISFLVMSRSKDKDTKSDGKEMGVILTELGYIKANTVDIKDEQRRQQELNQKILERLTGVEGKATAAHDRIDHIENYVLAPELSGKIRANN